MDLLGRLAGMPDADERFQKQVAYATSAWSGLMDNMTYRAAGNELLRAIKDATPEKPVDEEAMRTIGLKYHLTPERMDQLGSMLVKSGALPIALKEQQRRMRDEQLLAEASAQTGLPSESAARVKEKAITSTIEPQAEAKAPQTRRIERDGFIVTEEWDAASGAWKEIARSPKWNPKTGTVGGGTGGGSTSVGNGESPLNSDAIQLASAEFLKTGKMPALGMRNGSNRTLIINGAAAMAKERGIDPYNVPALRYEFSALGKSLNNQQKIYNMMGGFVRNLNKQVDRVSDIHGDLVNRLGTRALDVPIRQLKMRFKGSGNEAILEAYMTEISNEIGKLSTGSSASIAELSVGAQERWSKIHDPNLSMNELLKILTETKDMGAMRIDSSREEIFSTKGAMDNIWDGNKKNAPSKATSYLKSAKNRNDAIQRIRALRDKGWSKADLDAAAKEAGWE